MKTTRSVLALVRSVQQAVMAAPSTSLSEALAEARRRGTAFTLPEPMRSTPLASV